jgi:hypothetical protein
MKSTNWSGYAVDGNGFTDVRGSWAEPGAICSGTTTQFASLWVGLDGFNSASVEQIGTDADCNAGVPQYYAWYEMYPAAPVNLPLSYTVNPGDQLAADVSVSNSVFTLSIGSSAGWYFSVNLGASAAPRSSAEWIIEAPEVCAASCKIAKLTDFGAVKLSHSEAVDQSGPVEPISAFTAGNGPFRIAMTTPNGLLLRAKPSQLSTSGQRFWDTWEHA